MSLEELCAIACRHETRMADALLVACVNEGIETNTRLGLTTEQYERYFRVVAPDSSRPR